jgi:hypothetical protein
MKILLPICLAIGAMPLLQSGSDPHAAGVDARGDHGMGFSHETTNHHFRLLADGGVIEAEAKSETDAATRDEIRMHMTHIASSFAANDFDIPMFIHAVVPPGVPVMKEKHSAITYTSIETPKGAKVRIVTHDPDALKAVHEFLRFQIKDHRTGDSVAVTSSAAG